jgi:DNA-binding MurR/RpiR family transcriptional regulator
MEVLGNECLLTNISKRRGLFTPKQRLIADFIARNYSSLAYVTLSELSKMTRTGQGTVVRFAEALGYKTFSGLQSAIRSEIERSGTKTLDIFSPAFGKRGESDPAGLVFDLESAVMEETRRLVKKEEYELAVDILITSPAVAVTATGSNSFLADYASYFMSIIRKGVIRVAKFDLWEAQSICDLPQGSAALVFSFPRYPAGTESVTRLLLKRGVRVIGVSDSTVSPIAAVSKPLFVVPQKFISFIDPCAGAMSLIHALLYGMYVKGGDESRLRADRYEDMVREEGFFIRDDVKIPAISRHL